jgi:plastocyanin
MTRASATVLAALLGSSLSCSSSTGPGNAQTPPPPAAQSNDINIVAGAEQLTTTAFTPNPKVVSLGGSPSVTVRWVNKDITGGNYSNGTATAHNITSDNGAFQPSGPLGGNRTYSVTLTQGSYPYHCSIHPNMVGTVTINP